MILWSLWKNKKISKPSGKKNFSEGLLLFMIMAAVTAVYLLKTGITEIAVPVIALILCKVSQIYTTVLVLVKLVIWIFGISFIYHFIR